MSGRDLGFANPVSRRSELGLVGAVSAIRTGLRIDCRKQSGGGILLEGCESGSGSGKGCSCSFVPETTGTETVCRTAHGSAMATGSTSRTWIWIGSESGGALCRSSKMNDC